MTRGALVWLGYAIVQLAVNGVVLDETVIFAQTIAGAGGICLLYAVVTGVMAPRLGDVDVRRTDR